jgi:cytochrome P450
MTQNPEFYPNPDQFIPERFLGDQGAPDPRDAVFGFGRR